MDLIILNKVNEENLKRIGAYHWPQFQQEIGK